MKHKHETYTKHYKSVKECEARGSVPAWPRVITQGREAARRRPPPDTSINIHALIPCIVNGHFYRAENNGAATRITHHNHAGAGQAKHPTLHPIEPSTLNSLQRHHRGGDDILAAIGLRLYRRAIELIGACYLNFWIFKSYGSRSRELGLFRGQVWASLLLTILPPRRSPWGRKDESQGGQGEGRNHPVCWLWLAVLFTPYLPPDPPSALRQRGECELLEMPRRTLAETDHDLCEVSEKQGEQEGDLLIAQSFHQRVNWACYASSPHPPHPPSDEEASSTSPSFHPPPPPPPPLKLKSNAVKYVNTVNIFSQAPALPPRLVIPSVISPTSNIPVKTITSTPKTQSLVPLTPDIPARRALTCWKERERERERARERERERREKKITSASVFLVTAPPLLFSPKYSTKCLFHILHLFHLFLSLRHLLNMIINPQ